MAAGNFAATMNTVRPTPLMSAGPWITSVKAAVLPQQNSMTLKVSKVVGLPVPDISF